MLMTRSTLKPIAIALLATSLAASAHADSRSPQAPPLPKYQQECASCHTAFAPGQLPAASWQRIMGSLGKHYGVDASLDETSAREISGWLKAHAGTYKRVSEEPPQDRITKSAWFLRKHNEREVSPAVWKRTSVGSPANCAACHPNASQGSYSEHDIKIPR
ncbi:MAG: diheme cytochrome c [Rhodoferax sp.]|jgi:mono/diheme cytochrome c family protein|nr:diheme cytochrome c [Rhodoferax sp.]